MSVKHVHSVKVPKIYKVASKILQLVEEKGVSLKELGFDKASKRSSALVLTTILHKKHLDLLIKESQILSKEALEPWLTRVLITALLWGRKKLPAMNALPIVTVLKYHKTFLELLEKVKKNDAIESKSEAPHIKNEALHIKNEAPHIKNEAPHIKKEAPHIKNEAPHIKNVAKSKPCFIRVNTLLTSVDAVVEEFQRLGWCQVYVSSSDYPAFLLKLASLEEKQFLQDVHMRTVLAFPPRTKFCDYELFKSGKILVQDKATCLAAFVLNPAPDSTVLVVGAGYGKSTAHLAAIMENKGVLYAVDKNQQAYERLCEMVPHLGAAVTAIQGDAMFLTPKECPQVDYVLVDPTSSKSGTAHPRIPGGKMNLHRVEKLAVAQEKLLKRALTTFPSARRVVYTTSSVYPRENEEVVQNVLRLIDSNHKQPQYKLAEDVMKSWRNRGSNKYTVGPSCLLAVPDEDLTYGGFVAVFDRVEPLAKGDVSDEHASKVKVDGKIIEEEKNTKKRKRGKRGNKRKIERNEVAIVDGQVQTEDNHVEAKVIKMSTEETIIKKRIKGQRKRNGHIEIKDNEVETKLGKTSMEKTIIKKQAKGQKRKMNGHVEIEDNQVKAKVGKTSTEKTIIKKRAKGQKKGNQVEKARGKLEKRAKGNKDVKGMGRRVNEKVKGKLKRKGF